MRRVTIKVKCVVVNRQMSKRNVQQVRKNKLHKRDNCNRGVWRRKIINGPTIDEVL